MVVAMALRDAGAEVIYLGHRRTGEQILAAAAEEDVDVVGVSILSGSHLPLIKDLMNLERALGLSVPIIVGGTIPDADATTMMDFGVHSVFSVGTPLDTVVEQIMGMTHNGTGVST